MVLLDREAYNDKVRDLLDSPAYEKLTKDPTPSVQREMNKLLADTFKAHPKARNTYLQLICRNGSAPGFYGLPKTHKPTVPLRPIVDFTTSPLRALSKYLHRTLAPLVGQTPTHIRDASHFLERMRDVTVSSDECFVSFDVVSLFTSVPVALAVSSARAALNQDELLDERTCLGVDELCRLLEYCLKGTYFSVNGSFYRQASGTAMGAAISVTAANLTMEHIEETALGSFIDRPKVFVRYVDDCFCIIKKAAVDSFLEHLNSIDQAIQFTVERERDGALPFLDVLVRRQGERMTFSVYRKPTHTGRYLHFASCHPTAHKASVVSALLSRARAICTSEGERKKEEKRIVAELRRNGYTEAFIRRASRRLSRRQPPHRGKTPASDTPPDPLSALATPPHTRKTKAPNNRVAIPYVPGISEQLSRVLGKAGVTVIHKPVSTLARLLPRPKDRPPRELHPGVVYKVSCSGCPACYIGESKCFPERMRQHKNDVRKMEVQRSALAEHCEKHDHKIDLEGASVIETERNLGKRLLLESWHIQHTPANVNRSLGTMPSVYVHGLRNVVERESRSRGERTRRDDTSMTKTVTP
ncbi:uncharacterized protein LOC142804027 [Rhipicephalus microplus]|uniref:uncharacterized protein LOC142804027 n=1 Tax=Rhipicephalus microplus TaxID=6941 RepID=UPI003F6AF2CC